LTGFIMKLIICPAILVLSDFIFGNVNYAGIFQPIVSGVVLAALAHVLELIILMRRTLWVSTAADFAAAFIFIYFSQFFLPGANITYVGALLAATLLSVTEYFQHLFLIQKNKTRKME
jgi:hypothetical protein